jgi:hypothetical protein
MRGIPCRPDGKKLMQINALSSLNAVVQTGVQRATSTVPPKPQTTAPAAPVGAGGDSDGDNDGGRVGTQLNVKA